MNNIKNYNSIVSTGKILSITAVLFVAIGFIFVQPTFVNAWGYSDYGSTGSSNSNWGYSDYGSTGSSNSNWGYSDYGSYSPSSSWGYSDYGSYSPSSSWGYSDYGSYSPSSSWGYSDYGSYLPSNSNWGYSDYGSYSPSSSWGYSDYGSYLPSNSNWGYSDYGCSGSNCYSDYSGYGNYSYPDYGYQSYGGSAGGALGLNLNYSNTETNIIDNSRTDNSVRIQNNIDNSSTTNNCSNGNNASSSGNCNTTTVNNVVARNDFDIDLDVVCIVSDRTIEEGDTVTFEARIKGGRPSYRIEWSGDISGDDREERVRFNRRGTYEVTVEVRDANGDRASDDCEVVVRDKDDDDRRITVTTGTNLGTPTGNLSSLESVFLSQVPYTGPGDIAKALGILALIAVWSTSIALYLKKQRTVKVISNKIANFKEQNKNANKIA